MNGDIELVCFCKEHKDWETILTNAPYNLKIKRDDKYIIFEYSQLNSDFSSILVQQARGIILREPDLKPVCIPFFKFFNYGETNAAQIDWSSAFVTEKIDGSLMKVWYDDSWHISTNGAIDAFKAELHDVKMPNFGAYFLEALKNYYNSFEEFTNGLDVNKTYMFELIGPYNRMVIPYSKPDLYFLGARDNRTYKEFYCSAENAKMLNIDKLKRPAQFPLTNIDECLDIVERKSWDEEGFVVADKDFKRIKIKAPAYVLAHFKRNNNVITRKHLIKIILLNEIEEFICYADDYAEPLFEIKGYIDAYHTIGNKLIAVCKVIAPLISRANYAEVVKTFPSLFRGLLFLNYAGNVTAEEYTSDWSEAKWEEYIDSMIHLNKRLLERKDTLQEEIK